MIIYFIRVYTYMFNHVFIPAVYGSLNTAGFVFIHTYKYIVCDKMLMILHCIDNK